MKRLALLTAVLLTTTAAAQTDNGDTAPGFNEPTFKGLELRTIGPALMSGRIADIAIDPSNQSTWYAGVGSGGVWKTVNAGTTWQPVFDNEDAYSIGAVTVDPNNADVVWVGTGENVSGRHVGYGAGLYRSRDGGKSWENIGLEASERIGMIRVDPRDSNVVFVAAQGPLWSGGGQRGLYKSVDGGETWRKVLGEGLGNTGTDDEYTGVSEVHFDPRNPDVMFAVSWQRYRNVAVLLDGGPGTGIHKSEDGGETWRELTEGLPEETMGKVGLAVSPVDPDAVYATIELANRKGGFWRSLNGGESWEKRSEYLSSGTGPHYYQEIFASPHKLERVYQMDVHLHVTEDAGKTFTRMQSDSKHVDHHAMAFDSDDENYLLVGNDGGIYESFDLGETWRFAANLPITQFYKIAVDNDEPFYNVFGGTQDNSTQGGPSRTDNVVGIRNSDWEIILGADGHQPATDPSNPDIVYANWQQGNLTRYDRKTGESVYIRPQPAAGEPEERFNWDAPILVSPHDPARLYFASHRVWRSDNRGDAWETVSGDLTRDEVRFQQPVMGRRWGLDSPWDNYAMSRFNTITSLSESPLVEGLLYAGTDDGLIHVSEDGGSNWRRIDSLPGVPDRFFVNDIKADLHDPDTVYVVVDDHKSGDFAPYILKSENRGRRWQSIASNLPERHVLWRVVQDHVKPELLFLGTEFGVFFTVDAGDTWTKLAGNVPNIPFRDLAIQQRENDLVGGTFGRGIYILDDYSPLRDVTANLLENESRLFPVGETRWYVPRRPLGCSDAGCTGSQGDAFYVAPNPPFGAVFTYYLPEMLQTAQEARFEEEKEREKANEDVRFPGWEQVLEEELEDEPAVVFAVEDADGMTVRYVPGSVEAGFHRVAWDLRYPALDPWVPEAEREMRWQDPVGVLATPGTYSVSMYRRVDGEWSDMGQSQEFEVVSIREPTLPGSTQDERVAFDRQVDELRRATDGSVNAIDAIVTELDAVKETLESANADPALYTEANDIQQSLKRERYRLAGFEKRQTLNDAGPVSVQARLSHARYSSDANAYGPTQTQRMSLNIARDVYADVHGALRELDSRHQRLNDALDRARVPWTPGRGMQAADSLAPR